MARISGALQLTNLNDFITPSQECIKPIIIEKSCTKTGSKISIQEDGTYYQVEDLTIPQKLQKVEIALSDCLACSGCITSAESVLVDQQNQEELSKVFREKKILQKEGRVSETRFIIVSLSVQPVLSLAVKYNLEPNDCAARLAGYFKHLGADMVVDMTIAEDLALLESQKEFVERYSSAEISGSKNLLPMLSSSCPGWVCYAEKTHGSFILPYLSSTKSPQQIMGSIIKRFVQKLVSLPIYHVTLMPCYDKKLEAVREDFINKENKIKDVDCVITAIELEQMFLDGNISLNEVPPSTFNQPWNSENQEITPCLKRQMGSGSGGFAHNIFKFAAEVLFQVENPLIEFKCLRNPDFKELTLLDKNDKVALKFAIVNGFTNIQNLVRKLKRGKSDYHYVEVMACPSGCLNGGAMVHPQNRTVKDLTTVLEDLYTNLPIQNQNESKTVKSLYQQWFKGEEGDITKNILHTGYHEIEKVNVSLNIKW
ncbi:probable cytosolic Fe-S cluster assembly factor AGAP009023 [Agrilus planipennis]|uniref:Probable cytosolic Fe-S cluster assembly factor AGAP009023 n=1 Tax=Agrilus planipennis TaxID=224129 RepID=A0A1W4XQ27_AGRPL|nr:probable cytosolic Fe-S cluster assembly factor AGAP009023 [Agrilus planipennis]